MSEVCLTFDDQHDGAQPIPHGYPSDGCEARAHLMVREIVAAGYGCAKIFACDFRPNEGLCLLTDRSPDVAPGGVPLV